MVVRGVNKHTSIYRRADYFANVIILVTIARFYQTRKLILNRSQIQLKFLLIQLCDNYTKRTILLKYLKI